MRKPKIDRSCICYNEIWSDENELKSHQVFMNSHKKYKFNCFECYHTYEQTPNSKTNENTGCPYCSNQKLCCNMECIYCLDKSCFVYENIWSNENKLKSHQVFKNSHKKYKFKCVECNHTYEQKPNHKTNGKGCPYCSNYNSILCNNTECIYCLKKSCFVYEKIWSNENELKSYQVSKNSHKKYKFKCLKCNHTYEQQPYSKTAGNDCLYCCNQKLCCNLECMCCLEKSSYCYNDIWSEYNDKKSYEVTKSSSIKYKFNCIECNNIYEQAPASKTHQYQGCPYCKHKTEKKSNEFFK